MPGGLRWLAGGLGASRCRAVGYLWARIFSFVAHNADGATPSIAHTDITSDQFLNRGDDTFVLNDFNRARFVGMNETDGGAMSLLRGEEPRRLAQPGGVQVRRGD